MIQVFDNVFPFKQRQYYYNFVKDSNYRIGWPDSATIENLNQLYFFSSYGEEDMEKLGILQNIQKPELLNLIDNRSPALVIVNCDQFSTVHWPHTDSVPPRDVLLYYINLDWKTEWYGETLFYEEDGQEIKGVVSYKPGRIAFFDGDHPHGLRPSSRVAPDFRFTLSIFFDKKD